MGLKRVHAKSAKKLPLMCMKIVQNAKKVHAKAAKKLPVLIRESHAEGAKLVSDMFGYGDCFAYHFTNFSTILPCSPFRVTMYSPVGSDLTFTLV